MYIAKLKLLSSFYKNMVDELLLVAGVSMNTILYYKKRLREHLVFLKEEAVMQKFLKTFPCTLVVGGKVHTFDLKETLPLHQGVHLRLVGLPINTTKEKLRK